MNCTTLKRLTGTPPFENYKGENHYITLFYVKI